MTLEFNQLLVITFADKNFLPNFSLVHSLWFVINTKTLQFNKYCKGGPVKASKQQKSFWG